MSGSLFKSELMTKSRFFIPPEAAYNCIAELGEIGCVQFIDLNPDAASFQRQFVSDVKRCEDIERKLRFIESEIVKEDIDVANCSYDEVDAPAQRESVELETSIGVMEENIREVGINFSALMRNKHELLEMKNVLTKTEIFWNKNPLQSTNLEFSKFCSNTPLSQGRFEGNPGYEGDEAVEKEDDQSSMHLNNCTGVMDRARVAAFERMLWRVSKGNVFVRFADIEENMEDPKTGEKLLRSVFVLFYQGKALATAVKKMCDGFHATVYPCPSSAEERREMMAGVAGRLEDLQVVIDQTTQHRQALLTAAAQQLRRNTVKIRKMKSVYHVLNHFSLREGARVMLGEGWLPISDLNTVRAALLRAGETAGSATPPTLEKIFTSETHPTYHRTNKYTAGYQSLVDSYGVNTYREVNPAVFTIATFPFLFAVMFGDAGHGTILLISALAMIYNERVWEKKVEDSEIFKIFFGGRYIILMMGCFSIYTGLIYNDIFAKSFNIFGSHFSVYQNFTASPETPLKMADSFMLDPKDPKSYSGKPYPMGVDPVWLPATNSIQYLNGYKMKISLIFGVIHMAFGVMISLWNKISKRQYHAIFLEFIPQLVFLLFLFGYLISMIFIKWVLYGANKTGQWSEHCAPNLLITFISMMLFKKDPHDPKLDKCRVDNFNYEIFMFPGQDILQKVLVLTALMVIPIMLFGKPLYILWQRIQRRRSYTSIEEAGPEPSNLAHQEEEGFGDILIIQGIHTIEYVLGSISHTASYLRLWALSLAHNQLSEVLWSMVMRAGFMNSYLGVVMLPPIFAGWAAGTISVMVLMEGLSAFLHTLRLHWVEFQSKFYEGAGYTFLPFNFKEILKDAALSDKEMLKTVLNSK